MGNHRSYSNWFGPFVDRTTVQGGRRFFNGRGRVNSATLGETAGTARPRGTPTGNPDRRGSGAAVDSRRERDGEGDDSGKIGQDGA